MTLNKIFLLNKIYNFKIFSYQYSLDGLMCECVDMCSPMCLKVQIDVFVETVLIFFLSDKYPWFVVMYLVSR